MALTASISINGLDVRTTYGLEITSHEAHNSPELSGGSFEAGNREGSFPEISTLKSKQVKLNGWISSDTSHADLLLKIDALKTVLGSEDRGQKKFVLAFSNYSDRYFMARLISIKISILHPVYSSKFANIEINVLLDDPFGLYNTLSFANIGAAFSSPYSFGFNYSGSAIARPRILIENVGATALTPLAIRNVGCKNKIVKVAPGTCSNVARATGRWSDVKGAALFLAASNPSLIFPCSGNLNPGCFSIYFLFRTPAITDNAIGTLFSTTGDVIRIYQKAQNTFTFSFNGTDYDITTASFIYDQWWRFCVTYDGSGLVLSIKRIGGTSTYGMSVSGPISYRGLPTNLYVGTNADGSGGGSKYIDDLRIYNYAISTSEIDMFHDSLGPVSINRGCTLYLPFKDSGEGYQADSTLLTITTSTAQYSMLSIDCDTMSVNLLTANLQTTPTDKIADASGEFPFLVPGMNGFQIVYTGSANGINMAIEDKRRFA